MRITESKLRDIVREQVIKALNETVLGPNDKFTPYTQADRERNFSPIRGGNEADTRDQYQKNPSFYYAVLLKRGYTPEEAVAEVNRHVGYKWR